jgi:CO/xanthine dehydrogenase Mo-binding subunit
LPLYNKVDAVKFTGDVVYTNLTPAGAFRGYGAVQGNFALESAIDELADLLNMSPIKVREINMIKEHETSEIFKVMGEGTEGVAQDIESCKLDTCLKNVIEKIDWYNKYPRRIYGNKIRSVGLAIAMQGSGIPFIDMGSAILKLNDDGFFNLLVGATDLGTGSDTALAQIAAETLGVDTDRVIVYSSDTDITPFDVGAYASSTTFVSGNSVKNAAEAMVKKMKTEAKRILDVDSVIFDGVNFIHGNKKLSIKELSNELFYGDDKKQLVSNGSYYGKKSPPPYMAAACEIEIDKKTGKIDLLNYYASVDCGVTINPNLATIQVEGALVQSIGMTLYEHDQRDEKGYLLNKTFLNYTTPTKMDFGPITVDFVESYEPSGPYGAKSVGEIGSDTPPAAIANAIKNALGVRVNKLPITSETIWKILDN